MRSMTLCDNEKKTTNGINYLKMISGRQYLQGNTINMKSSKLGRRFAFNFTGTFYYILRIINGMNEIK